MFLFLIHCVTKGTHHPEGTSGNSWYISLLFCFKRESRQRIPNHWFSPPMPAVIGSGSGWTQETRTQFKSSLWVAETRSLEPSPALSLKLCIAGNWELNPDWCRHYRQCLKRYANIHRNLIPINKTALARFSIVPRCLLIGKFMS